MIKKIIARQGGTVAGNAGKEIEQRTGKPVVTDKNAIDYLHGSNPMTSLDKGEDAE